MRAYEEYKQIGLPWLDRIPAHWKVQRAKSMFKKMNRPASESDEVITCFRDGEVTLRSNRRTTGFTESLKEIGYQGIHKGDLVIHVMDAFAGAVGVSDSDGKGTPVYSVCTPKGNYNNYYYANIIRIMAKAGYIQSLYRGIRERSSDFRFEVFADQYLPIPPREEQDAIVRFLDAKCAKIDSLIKLKERQIALLNEKKQNIINQAVTRGLDPNAPMKDSGVDWIGEIPEGWEVLRCKYLFTETNVRSEKGEETHLSMSQKYGLVPDSMMEEKRMLSESYAGGKLCCKDDIVLNRLKAHLGVFALASQDGVVSPDYTVLSINKNRIFSHYAECILKSYSCRRELVIRVRGIVNGFLRLYTEDFNTIKLPLPTIDEQKRIMEFVSKIERIIKTKIDILENNILLMNEYRQRLISDVVTGKINILEGNSDV